ncbi:MAG: RpiB/LacA/LacB family sugar-phosphate isomerase [Planctomycetaceae bacterium]|nr:RpiB/LacA/LacB family sugar-phosphate isomerase [Planctomycetaceae bacterium]
MKIIVGSPVKGFKLKTAVVRHLTEQGHEIIDVGCYNTDHFVKYPAIGERVARALADGAAELALNCCGSGTGAAISANKFIGVLACACESVQTAALIRIVNGANCLCMGEDIVSEALACEMADAFINAKFQDNPNAAPEIREFWKEARDEMIAKGVAAREREIEML